MKNAVDEGKHVPYGFYEAVGNRQIELILSLFLLLVFSGMD